MIAIPVLKKTLTSPVSPSFGRAAYFLIYDTKKKEGRFVDNVAADQPGGAGILAAQILADQEATALLTPRCGENAAAVLKAADIKLYQSKPGTAQENIDAFSEGKLSGLLDIHAGHYGRPQEGRHGHGG